MKLGTVVGLWPSHIVLDGDLAPRMERRTAAPNFRPMSVVANGRPSQQLLSSCSLLGAQQMLLSLRNTRAICYALSHWKP